jgi:hypothetical protein
MYAYNVFLNNVRKYDLRRNGKSIIKRLYNFNDIKKLKIQKVTGVCENERAKVIVDTTIKTNVTISHKKTDIVAYDKKKNEMKFIEVGITSQENLQRMELELDSSVKRIYSECDVLGEDDDGSVARKR